jgi:PAS domain S-box-containing protein
VSGPRGGKDGGDLIAARLRQVVGRVSALPCLMVGTDGRIAELSASAAKLLGARRDALRGERIRTVAGSLWRSEPMRQLQSGAIDAYAARSALRRLDGRMVPVSVWARLVESSDARWIVLACIPADGTAGPSLVHAIEDGPTAIGFGDGEGNIAMVSDDILALTGFAAAHLERYPAHGFIHADDLPEYTLAISTVLATGKSHHLRIRVRHADGGWVAVRSVIAAITTGGEYRVAFMLRAEEPAPEADRIEQLTELEGRLRRIAIELAAVGVSDHVDPEVARLLSDLSPRQQEVVRLLQEGARVPTIAQELFLSQSTVRNHLSAIFRKFGVSSQEELLRAMRR